ncbi:hypothetical protein BGZ96_002782 [Linnemannia gamsii]|uniref:Peptidase A1 domain-containing protein n=1 Tax=Linnemannia gamsii TaxID=64522 RepID=A0ABQ7JKB2_9FUNG|nr:hypothetical protein BGZ96_002782 [Linnemannia gamsii]
MVNKILLILLLSVACASASPTPRHSSFKATLMRPASPIRLKDVYRRDMKRWAKFDTNSFSIPAINEDVSYTITVGLGTPVTNVSLIFDTGSSNLWVKSTAYNPLNSRTANYLGETFSIQYGSGNASGKEYTDVASLGCYKFTQEFGVSSNFSGFSSTVQGLVGFGPDDLSTNVTSTGEKVLTPVDNLYSTHQISSNVIGVWFQPITNGGIQETNGEITFGGHDSTKYYGKITYVPITTASPASEYWGIDIAEIAFGTTKVTSTIHGIVDTGTTLILLSSAATSSLYEQIPGAKVDNDTTLYIIPPAEVPKLKDITFNIGHRVFVLTPAQYTVPQNQVANIGGKVGTTYSWISSLGDNESGLAFILGQKFLENFYSVYDTTHKRVGLARAVKATCKKRQGRARF